MHLSEHDTLGLPLCHAPRSRWLPVVSLGLAAFVLSTAEGQTPPGPRPAAKGPGAATQPAITGPASTFRCDESTFTFPDAWTGDKIEHTYTIANDGDGKTGDHGIFHDFGYVGFEFGD